jgi:hypothetical protein
MKRQNMLRWNWRLMSGGAVVAWMIFIFQASSLPPEEVDRSLQAFLWLGKLRSVLGHLTLYGVLASLLQISLWLAKQYGLLIALGAGCYGAGYPLRYFR